MRLMLRVLPHRAFIEPRASVSRFEPQDGAGEATLRVDGLLCSACAANVRARLEGLHGVRGARVDLERGEAVVTYDRGLVQPEGLVEAVEDAVVLRPLRRLLARLGGDAT